MASSGAAAAAAQPASNFVTLNGLKLHYLDWGGDPAKGTIVLIHGGSGNLPLGDGAAPVVTRVVTRPRRCLPEKDGCWRWTSAATGAVNGRRRRTTGRQVTSRMSLASSNISGFRWC